MSSYNLEVEITTLVDRNATVTKVDLFGLPGNLWVFDPDSATGASKRENGDKYDAAIALDYSVGRALESLGRQLRHRAEKSVKAAVANGQSS